MRTKNKSDVVDAVGDSADVAISPPTVTTGGQEAGLKTTGLSDDDCTESDQVSNDGDGKDESKLTESGATKKKGSGNVLLLLIMDICQPHFGSGRVVIMDNYYTSPGHSRRFICGVPAEQTG